LPGAHGETFFRGRRSSSMSKHTAKFFSRLTLSHVISIGLTAGLLVFGFVAVGSAEHSLFWN
jgi:hypothetical protein